MQQISEAAATVAGDPRTPMATAAVLLSAAEKLDTIAREMAALAAEYLAKIGYDPFEDDPTIDPDTVRQTLKEHDELAAGDPPHDDTDWMGIHHGRNA
jgi:hypothetical protein